MTNKNEIVEGYTPGPWTWAGVYEDGSGPMALHADGVIVIEPFIDYSLEPGEGIDEWGMHISAADARLIAAAPDMLAALKSVREANGSNKHFPAACMTAINAAIAKAEGRT